MQTRLTSLCLLCRQRNMHDAATSFSLAGVWEACVFALVMSWRSPPPQCHSELVSVLANSLTQTRWVPWEWECFLVCSIFFCMLKRIYLASPNVFLKGGLLNICSRALPFGYPLSKQDVPSWLLSSPGLEEQFLQILSCLDSVNATTFTTSPCNGIPVKSLVYSGSDLSSNLSFAHIFRCLFLQAKQDSPQNLEVRLVRQVPSCVEKIGEFSQKSNISVSFLSFFR